MNTTQISINFSIFNSILNGSLDPRDNLDENLCRIILANGFRAKSENLNAFFTSLESILNESCIVLEDDNYKQSAKMLDKFDTPLSIEFPPFINKKTQFYNILIKNETIRIQALIDFIITSEEDEDIAYKDASAILADLENLILISSKKHEDILSNIHILDCLKFSLFVLYTYLIDNYSQFLTDDRLTENELKYILAPSGGQDNLIIKYLDHEISSFNPKQSGKKTKHNCASTNLKSFEYLNWKSTPDYLEDLFQNLKTNKLIHQDTSLSNFRKVFMARKIDKPVVWTGNISELHYFIKLIHNINKSVKNLQQQHWEVACKCFVDENHQAYERTRLKDQKIPKSTAHIIEKAAKLLI